MSQSNGSVFVGSNATRREFLGQAAAAVVGAAVASELAIGRVAHAAGNDTLKIGLVGCGGRGTGAANQALNADPNVKLVAMADAFRDQIDVSLSNLKKQTEIKDKIDVAEDRKYVGFDAYKQLIDSDVDVVLLATSPHFRPLHVEYAAAKGKHMFVEKPVCVDVPGYHRISKACEVARSKKLSIVSGLCYRYEKAKQETIKRIHDGAIGDIRAMECYYHTNPLWHKGRDPKWSEMEFQVRNWLYFCWLSGDHIVEQHIHSYDKMIWANKDVYPISAFGIGGRQVRTGAEYGNIYDHFHVVYELPGGVSLHAGCRQMSGTDGRIEDIIVGTKGKCNLQKATIYNEKGEVAWKCPRIKGDSMYQNEHDVFFASIRSGQPVDNSHYMTNSSLMGIMGRTSAYTGKVVTWEQILQGTEDLTPPKYDWINEVPVAPVPMPGVTKMV